MDITFFLPFKIQALFESTRGICTVEKAGADADPALS
jgi:hypothetical protein